LRKQKPVTKVSASNKDARLRRFKRVSFYTVGCRKYKSTNAPYGGVT